MSRITVRVIGTAQDGGVPQIGCDCANCRRARSDFRRFRYPSSLALHLPLPERGESTFLLDASPALPAQMDMLPGEAPVPDGILLTHVHAGHYTGLQYLGKEYLSAREVPVFCRPRVAKFLQDNEPWATLVRDENIRLMDVSADRSFSLGSLSVDVMDVPHRNEYSDTCAFILRGERSLLYMPDVDGWDGFAARFNAAVQTADYAFIDGTFYRQDELETLRQRPTGEVPHPPVQQTLDLLADGTLYPARRATYFTHLNHTNPLLNRESAAHRRVALAGCRVAVEGLCIPLDGWET